MDWGIVGDAVGWVEDEVIDTIVEGAEDLANYVEEEVVDPVVNAAKETVDFIEDNITDPFIDKMGDFGEWIEDTIIDIGEEIEDAWGDFAEAMEDLLDTVSDAAENAWEAIVEAAERAWEWLEEKTLAAIDWLIEAIDLVYDFIVEEAIPFIISAVELVFAFVKLIGALVALPLCYLIKEWFGDEEATLIEGIELHSPRLLEEMNIARNPVNQKYAVFSDQHLFSEGSMNFFKNNSNAEIYHVALEHYSANNYYLIEAGDVEDFWMRNGIIKETILLVSENLPWPYFSEPFELSAFRSANQVHALNVFLSNATTYARVRTLFHDQNKYTRLIGNHDDVWDDSSMFDIFDMFYPGGKVYDYCTLDSPATRNAQVIIAHGHQWDIFNTPMCNFAGKAVTEFATKLHEISFGEWNQFTTAENDWEKEWSGHGFNNELQEMNLLKKQSFSECNIYKDMENIYGSYPHQPYIILGHTHKPKDYAGIPNHMNENKQNWDEYSNSGTTGMWQNIVFGLEVDYPDIQVVAWKKDRAGVIQRYELNSYTYGETYLKES